MKKTIAILTILLAVILLPFVYGHMKESIPLSPPSIHITYTQSKIDSARGMYNWFDEPTGGNTAFSDIPENLVKNLKAVSVQKEGSIHFDFKSLGKPPTKTKVSLIIPNKQDPLQFDMIEQPLHGNAFTAPKESGVYIFLIDGDWDATHCVEYAFKIKVE